MYYVYCAIRYMKLFITKMNKYCIHTRYDIRTIA